MYEYKYKIDKNGDYKTVNIEDLKRHAKILYDYYEVNGVLSITPEFIDCKDIVIDNSINIAQAGGNTPQEIGVYTQIFNEERFDPFKDCLPLVYKTPDGKYKTIGGYKRVMGKQRSNKSLDPMIPVLVITFDSVKEKKAIGVLNSIENAKSDFNNPKKKNRDLDSLGRSLNHLLKESFGIDITNANEKQIEAVLSELKVSKEGFTRKQVTDAALKLMGATVPEPLSTDEILIEAENQLKSQYPNAHFVAYSVKGKAISLKDRLYHFLSGMNEAQTGEFDTCIFIVQHTGVNTHKEKLYNKQYLQFENSDNNTPNYVAKLFDKISGFDASFKVKPIFGVINDNKITLQ